METVQPQVLTGPPEDWVAARVTEDDALSMTSYATSVSGASSGNLRVPPPPNEADVYSGVPFICPYCFSEEVVKSNRAWKYVQSL